jgi:plastocyanin
MRIAAKPQFDRRISADDQARRDDQTPRKIGKEETMNRKKRIRLGALVLAAGMLVATSAYGSGSQAKLTIRHQIRGCHAWSYDGGAYKASLKVKLAAGTTLTITNNDVMPHKLIQLSGAKLHILSPNMNHMSATAKVTFLKKGTYHFMTKPGEDYMQGMKTLGPDNVLRLSVTVS